MSSGRALPRGTPGRDEAAPGEVIGGGQSSLPGANNDDVGRCRMLVASRLLLDCSQTFFTTPDLSCMGPMPSTLQSMS